VGIEAPRNLNYVVNSLVDEPFAATPKKIEQLETWKICGGHHLYHPVNSVLSFWGLHGFTIYIYNIYIYTMFFSMCSG
jgi:hypothetical protein